MPRALLRRSSHLPYHITSRANNRDWFYIDMQSCWDVFANQLMISARRYEVVVHLFVLMSNHFHMLVTTPKSNVDAFMQHLISGVTHAIQSRTSRINHVFGGRYRWTLLHDPMAVAYAYKYVARNPVRAGICGDVSDYRFSSISSVTRLRIPIAEGIGYLWKHVPKTMSERTAWLNMPSTSEREALVRMALRRYEFKFSTSSNLQKQLRDLKTDYAVEKAPLPFGTESSLTLFIGSPVSESSSRAPSTRR